MHGHFIGSVLMFQDMALGGRAPILTYRRCNFIHTYGDLGGGMRLLICIYYDIYEAVKDSLEKIMLSTALGHVRYTHWCLVRPKRPAMSKRENSMNTKFPIDAPT
jgi:hypothetical protein